MNAVKQQINELNIDFQASLAQNHLIEISPQQIPSKKITTT